MTEFLAGAASLAVIIGAILGIVRWRRSRMLVMAVIVESDFDLPPIADETLNSVHRALAWDPPVEGEADPRTPGGRLLADLRTLDAGSLWKILQADKIVHAEIHNRGHNKAEEVALRVPGAVLFRLEKEAEASREACVGNVVEIGDLRPGERVELTVWADHHFGAYEILLGNGRGKIRKREPVNPFWVKTASIFGLFKDPFMAVLLWIVILTFLLSLLWTPQSSGETAVLSDINQPADIISDDEE